LAKGQIGRVERLKDVFLDRNTPRKDSWAITREFGKSVDWL